MAREPIHIICTREGCGKPHIARGLCHMHYRRDLRAGIIIPAKYAKKKRRTVKRA